MMIWLFPPACLAALLVVAASMARPGEGRRVSPGALTVLAGLVLSYLLGLVLVSADPWFEDNGVREFIEWRFRWAWAAEYAGWLALLVVPVTWAIQAIWRASRRRA